MSTFQLRIHNKTIISISGNAGAIYFGYNIESIREANVFLT